jgi:hypothetical protein
VIWKVVFRIVGEASAQKGANKNWQNNRFANESADCQKLFYFGVHSAVWLFFKAKKSNFGGIKKSHFTFCENRVWTKVEILGQL